MDPSKYSIGKYLTPSLFLAGILSLCFWLSSLSSPLSLLSYNSHCSTSSKLHNQNDDFDDSFGDNLDAALARVSTANKTLIIAVVNEAYANEDVNAETTMLDVFLDGFWLGEDTRPLLKHLLIVAVDRTAYDRCRFLRLNCFRLETDGVDFGGEKLYMSEDFIKMMWRRTWFLLEVLKRGYNFIFTDTDVMWLRNPLAKLSSDESEDVQMSTDSFSGNPWGKENNINTGFYFVRSNNKTIALFDKWYNLKDNSTNKKEQDVLLELFQGGIISKLFLKVRFLDTLYFSGFCSDSKDFTKVATVHANCCRSIAAKIVDLRTVLRDWKRLKKKIASASYKGKGFPDATMNFTWSPHSRCLNSWTL